MLWNVIFEFFVKYVFGGFLNGQAYIATFGDVLYSSDYSYDTGFTSNFSAFKYFDFGAGEEVFIPLGNYLSLIATIITIVALLLACVFLIKKIIGVMFRLFTFGA